MVMGNVPKMPKAQGAAISGLGWSSNLKEIIVLYEENTALLFAYTWFVCGKIFPEKAFCKVLQHIENPCFLQCNFRES